MGILSQSWLSQLKQWDQLITPGREHQKSPSHCVMAMAMSSVLRASEEGHWFGAGT